MGGSPKQTGEVNLKEVKEKQALTRSQLLRGALGFIPESSFRQRKRYLAAKVYQYKCPAIPTQQITSANSIR